MPLARHPHVLFALMCLIWGATWIAMKVGISAVPPILFAGTRFVAAGLILLGWLALAGRPRRIASGHWGRLAVATVLIVAIPYALLFWGALHVSSGLAAVLDLSFIPVALLAVAVLLGEETFRARQGTAIVVGIAGLALLFGPKALAGAGAGGSLELWGGVAIVASAIIYGIGSVLARPLLRAYDPVLVSGMTILPGGVLLTAGALLLEPRAVEALSLRWGWVAWSAWAFLVLFGSVVAYTIYMRLLRDWGASRAGSYAFVSPVIAVLLGVAVLGEQVGLLEGAGMVVMLAAAWLAVGPGEPDPQTAPAPIRR